MKNNEIMTTVCHVCLTDDGIIRSDVSDGAQINLKYAKEVLCACEKISPDKKRPQLIHMGRMKSIDKEARHHLAREGVRVSSAVALVLGGRITHVVANFFLGLDRTPVPFKAFVSEPEAVKWLKKYL